MSSNEESEEHEEAQSDLEQNVSAGEESNHPAEDDAEVDPANPLDEDSVEAAQNLTQEDVFGEDLSDSSDDEQGERRKRGENGDGTQEGEEEEEGHEQHEEEEEEEQITVDTPQVTCQLGRDIHLVKLPNFMKVQPKPYDPQYLLEEIRDDDDEESKARLKLQIENTIRWRYAANDNGEINRESNTRLVRWSDGSLSLHVGKEIFDVSKANIQNDHNHLFVRHQKSMQAQAVFRTKLSFRQHSNDSLAHLKLKFASKANPAPKVRVLSNIKLPLSSDPDQKRREEQKMRAAERRQNQQLRQRERDAYRDRTVSSGYLEDREDDADGGEEDGNEQESLKRIKDEAKLKKKKKSSRTDDTSEDEEDEEEEEEEDDQEGNDDPEEKFLGQRTTISKHRKVASSDEEQSDNEQQAKRKRTQPEQDAEGEAEEEESD